ncbi:glycosyltransferase [Alicyclobacillus fastidiosus]|uniref:Glycosyltransferase n=1 Tax=Alicyclobacillus fastidiosus TaxID=392011 RepID=A0ABY6ZJN2_9BACL|nr:macrolide family glycosyltransferase [Alicyclobacillus fastidiosus]WAH43138.1 glycosyltransferase [Alicyclobacillus fastidiosus]GMA65149.1 glycosyl transferase family 1 [Alicyclobacillus fastidiosus]
MARVLFVNGGAEGHINPTLGVVQELVRRGEEVVYFTSEQFRERIEAVGATVHTYDGVKFFKAFLSGEPNHLLSRVSGLLRTAEIVIPSVLTQTANERFDYIIHDSMFGCGRLLAQILNLPAINSCTSFAFQKSSFDKMLENFSRRAPAEVNETIQQDFLQMVSAVQKAYGVEVSSAYDVFCNPAPMTIVYTSKRFQPGGESFDDTYKFVGPSVVSRAMGDTDMPDLDVDNVIYISLGTVFNRAIDFYKLCFAAFADTKYKVVLSVGRQTQMEELGDIPDNFIVRNYVPQLEVLQRAKLFITHGGMNSTSEGLYYGVPLMVLPQNADQPIVARRVANIGAGVHLDAQALTPEYLRENAESVLADSSIHSVCREIGDSFRAAGGYERAVDEIFAYTRSLGVTG